jgi:hypothetical protein
VEGQATYHTPEGIPDVSVSFGASATFRLTTDKLVIDVGAVDIGLPLWLKVMGFVVGPLVAGAVSPLAVALWPIVYGVLSAVLDNTIEEMATDQLNGAMKAARHYTFKLPGTTGPECSLRLDTLHVGSFGALSWFSFDIPIEQTGASVSVPYRIPAGDTPPVIAQFKPGNSLYNAADPTVRIRWELRRGRTGAVLRSQDKRPYAATSDEIFAYSGPLYVTDRLKRDKPFVRWSHSVYYERYVRSATGVKTRIGWMSENRRSKIHRTDTPGRCKFAERFPEDMSQSELEYLTALPFPASALAEHRKEVCDYCFYGGPTKTTPLPRPGA